VQGFLYCRPLPMAELERWHQEWLHTAPERANVA
jgi:hypothetical protein